MNKIKRHVFLLISLITSIYGCDSNTSSSNNLNTNSSSSSSNLNSKVSSATSSSSKSNEIYKVTFKDGEKVIYEYEGKCGDFIDIPEDLVSSDPRMEFKGWEGIDEYDYEIGKIEIFEDDQVFNAIWSERFGTENEYTATKLRSDFSIMLDGEKDEAYNDATKISISTLIKGETDTTAEAYLMWDSSYFYVFVDVKDSTVITRDYSYSGDKAIEHYDSLEIWLDLLHDDSLASPGYKDGWGGVYRGEPGPMCEAHYKINAGFIPVEEKRFGAGSEACWDGWWSNVTKDDGVSAGYSKITDTGYTVEYKICALDSNIPDYLRLKENEQIGVGIKIFDKSSLSGDEDKAKEAENIIAMEYINGNMTGPKKLSNINLIVNPNENI